MAYKYKGRALFYGRCIKYKLNNKMLYAIIADDVENSLEKRLKSRDSHIKRLNELKNQGRLILAGPHLAMDFNNSADAFAGSLIVAEFEDLDSAKSWVASDPYVLTGVYKSVIVKAFKKVLP